MKKFISFALIAILFLTPIPFLGTKQTVSAQSISNYDTAVKQGEKVKALNSLLNSAIKDTDLEKINNNYDSLTTEVKKLEQSIGKVSGSTNRKKLSNTYLVPAKVTIERVIYEVSQYRLLGQVFDLIDNEETTKAESNMMKLERLKKRAVAIKQAGGYEELPFAINEKLRKFEALFQGDILYQRMFKYEDAINAGKIEALNQLYDNMTKQLKLTQQRIGQVPGAENREFMNEYYVTPAKVLIERTIYEISQYRLLISIKNDIEKGTIDTEGIKQKLATLDRLKDRAAKIKETGGYDPLPLKIEQTLKELEALVTPQKFGDR
ncbi:hypothetical protein [Metabacillus fastidiosus]|uniref:hypothetical protein n=1 Tax=Metabacillus fastidiosus TaxID=1458 RepID=UPI002DB57AA9|nr:hypothetical protein [Metabacillus fastidiosus]MEC2076292.1 hypothetical protein [Metabacillus fastidiosus]